MDGLRLTIIAGLALLAGCAIGANGNTHPNADAQMTMQGNFPSYRSALASNIFKTLQRHPYERMVPRPVLSAYSECAASYLMSSLTDSERDRLDSYARHESTMSWNESDELERQMQDRVGGPMTYDTLDRLSGTCPADIASFKEYLEPIFQKP